MFYRVPKDVEREVLRITSEYNSIKKNAADENAKKQLAASLQTLDKKSLLSSFDDYDTGITAQYGGGMPSRTNNISRKTENLAILHSMEIQALLEKAGAAYAEANAVINAVDRGIIRAAETCPKRYRRKSINSALRQNLLDGVSRDELSIHSNTTTKYKKRAIYFIACELRLIEPQKTDY